jgi:HK97 gp10 family phage protein
VANQADGIKVQNLRQVTRALKAIGEPASEIRAAGKDAGQIVANEAKSLTPVRTGKLRDSIRVSALGSGAVRVAAGNNTRVPYANPIHWGWFYDKKNFVRKNIKPNPFFSKAIRVKREEVLDRYFENMEKLINKWTTKGITND